ncbi:MAG: hypothetical protein ACRC5C_03840 [Bacilli bacterium]
MIRKLLTQLLRREESRQKVEKSYGELAFTQGDANEVQVHFSSKASPTKQRKKEKTRVPPMTEAAYLAIQMGMSYESVVSKIGGEGLITGAFPTNFHARYRGEGPSSMILLRFKENALCARRNIRAFRTVLSGSVAQQLEQIYPEIRLGDHRNYVIQRIGAIGTELSADLRTEVMLYESLEGKRWIFTFIDQQLAIKIYKNEMGSKDGYVSSDH